MRQLPASESHKVAEIAWFYYLGDTALIYCRRYRHKGVAAFDLAGPEFGFSSKLHKVVQFN